MSLDDDIFQQIEEEISKKKVLINKEIKNNYEDYFKGTIPLKNNFYDEILKINMGCRKFRAKDGVHGYDELFPKQKQKDFSGISEKISYLFPPEERVFNKRIGFRYYKEDPLSTKKEILYFTLVLRDYRKFEILEKNSTILDANGKSFIDENLDCYDIINTIIKDKFKEHNNIDYQFPYSIVELLGFIYALKENSSKNKIILHPYFPSPFIPETRVEIFEKKENMLFLEPLLYKEHASLLLFFFAKNIYNDFQRYNFLFDFSFYHYNSLSKGDPIFPSEMSAFLKVYPFKGPIQFGPSCSIWFIGTILTLMEMDKLYFKDLRDNTLLFKIINKINQVMNINNNYLSLEKIEDKENENLSNIYFVSYKIALSPFIKINSLLNEFYGAYSSLKEELVNYQIAFDEFRKRIIELKYNLKYHEIISGSWPFKENEINEMITSYNTAKELFFKYIQSRMDSYKRIFYQKDNIIKNDNETQKEKQNFKKELDTELDNRKIKYDYFHLLKKEEIFKIYNDNNDIYLSLFNNWIEERFSSKLFLFV